MSELAISLTSDETDRLLQAEADVRGYCGWHIAPSRTDVQVTLPPSYSSTLMLPSLYVTAVSAVTEDGTAVDAADYKLDERGWLTRTYGRWCVGPIVVTMTHGYATVPPDVTGVVQSVAQAAIDGRSGAQSWSRAIGPFNSSANYGASSGRFTPAERETLDRYKLPPRP